MKKCIYLLISITSIANASTEKIKPMPKIYKHVIAEMDREEDENAWYNQSLNEAKDILKRYDAHIEKEGHKDLSEKEKELLASFEKAIMAAYDNADEKAQKSVKILFETIKHKLESKNMMVNRHEFAQKCLDNLSSCGKFLAFMYFSNKKDQKEKSNIHVITINIKSRNQEPFWEKVFMINDTAFYKTQDHMNFGHFKKHKHHHGYHKTQRKSHSMRKQNMNKKDMESKSEQQY